MNKLMIEKLHIRFLSAFVSLLMLTVPAVSGILSDDAGRYADGQRKWTSQVSVAVRYFWPERIMVSPNGSRFFFVTYHGDVSCDCNVFELSVFATTDIQQALAEAESKQRPLLPKPLRTLARRTVGLHTTAISGPRWELDGESVIFEGLDEKGIKQFYLFNVNSGKITQTTNWEYNGDYSFPMGDTIISYRSVPKSPTPPLRYPMQTISRNELARVLNPEDNSRLATFVSYGGGTPWELKTSRPDSRFVPFFSPDGRRAVVLVRPNEAPTSWDLYDRLSELSKSGDARKKTDFPQFVLIDAKHGSSMPVFDAPMGEATKVGEDAWSTRTGSQALWAQDQRHVILINTALPIKPGENAERARMAYIIGYDADTGKWEIIEPLESRDNPNGPRRRVAKVGWLKPGKELLIGHEIDGKPATGMVYTLQGNKWIGREVSPDVRLPQPEAAKQPSLPAGISVTLRQGANEPLVVMASNGKNELALTAADPALEGVWWAQQQPFQWQEPSGKLVTGGLLLPRETKGPVPLVIQAYTYEPELFQPDGPARHAYAAQSLAARGVAVLNLDIPSERGPREFTAFRERIESVVEALSSRGLIDRARVGLIGFSRAGFETYNAIANPGKTPLAAVVIDDAFPGTYSYYLTQASLRGASSGAASERPYGQGNFWQNKAAWLENEPSFNTDRVKTPALFTVHHQQGVMYAMETIGAFSLNRRPLEYLVFPNGRHQLSMPRQRLASYEATVDWMSFWLLGEIPSDPERSARWAKLRTQQEAVLKEFEAKGEKLAPLPPLVPTRQSSTIAVKQN